MHFIMPIIQLGLSSKCHFIKLQVSVCVSENWEENLTWCRCTIIVLIEAYVLINYRNGIEGDGSGASAFLIKPFTR